MAHGFNCSAFCCSALLPELFKIFLRGSMAIKERFNCTISRGLAFSSDTFEISVPNRPSGGSASILGSRGVCIKYSTASSRSFILPVQQGHYQPAFQPRAHGQVVWSKISNNVFLRGAANKINSRLRTVNRSSHTYCSSARVSLVIWPRL